MKNLSSLFAIAALTLSAAHCGPDNGSGFLVQGSIAVQIPPNTATEANTGFQFPPQTRIDPTLPSGRSTGYVGTCTVGSNTRSLTIDQIGGDQMGLRSITVSMPDWSQDTCTNCVRGTVTLNVGGTTFSGTDDRSMGASSPCTFTAARVGSFGMTLDLRCPSLQSAGRIAALTTNLTLDACNGPMTRN
ncbi:MAG: hypothetical protein Q8Q09_00520 [Deltaproteobacteria bacterium]|nr:hypothetical protein [Deltaproteobacteria bacterium]